MKSKRQLTTTTALIGALAGLTLGCAQLPAKDDPAAAGAAEAAPQQTEEPIKLKLGGYWRSGFTVKY